MPATPPKLANLNKEIPAKKWLQPNPIMHLLLPGFMFSLQLFLRKKTTKKHQQQHQLFRQRQRLSITNVKKKHGPRAGLKNPPRAELRIM